ncbi:MAG: BMP family ABC transporter substrate-binding protein [Promethearchaeota archaeon]
MNRYRHIFLVLILFFSFLTLEIRVKNTLEATPLSVACVFGVGGLGDKGFNDMAYLGLQKAQTDGLCTFSYKEPANIGEAEIFLQSFAADGIYDLIISVGSSYQQAVNGTAQAYPNQAILSIDTVVNQGNVSSVLFETNEGSFLVGALAGSMSKTGRIGFIGGQDIPLIREFWAGFVAGAYYVKNDSYIEVYDDYVGDFGDPATAKTMAEDMWKEGIDIIFAAAGKSGIGVLESANETRGVYAIGVDSNQDNLYPGEVLTSMMKRLDLAIYSAIEDILNARWHNDLKKLGLSEDGVSLTPMAHTKDLIGTQIIDRVNVTLRNKIINNEISVPTNFSSLSQWITDLNIINKSYTPFSGVISVVNDNEFSPTFSGSGTPSNPYIIEGLYINEASGVLISISDTRANFRISNNLINGYLTSGHGIYLSNVTHGNFSHNAIINCGGIATYDSENNTIIENSIINCGYGIYFESSNYSLISGNWMYDNKYNGIKFVGSSVNNTITWNTVFKNGLYSPNVEAGIYIREHSYNTTISHNTVHSNGHHGISFIISEGNSYTNINYNVVYKNNWGIGLGGYYLGQISTGEVTIMNNEAYQNDMRGIQLSECVGGIISNNTVYGNLDGGIGFYSSEANTIQFNSIHSNGKPTVCNGVCASTAQLSLSFDCRNNLVQLNEFAVVGIPGEFYAKYFISDVGTNNTSRDNYWSDWSGSGPHYNPYDPSPLLNPLHLSAPIFTSPTTDVEKLEGIINIQWTSSIDTYGHPLTYTLYFSNDSGSTWIELASELTGTNYSWDLSNIYNGTSIRFKIQALDNVGFKSTTFSLVQYIVINPDLIHLPPTSTSPTSTSPSSTSPSSTSPGSTSPTSTLPTSTSPSSTPTKTDTSDVTVTPSWTFHMLLPFLFIIFLLKHKRKTD